MSIVSHSHPPTWLTPATEALADFTYIVLPLDFELIFFATQRQRQKKKVKQIWHSETK